MKSLLILITLVSSFYVYARGENDGSGVVKRSKPVTKKSSTIRDETITINYDIVHPAIAEKNAEILDLHKQIADLARKGHALAADLKACKGRKYASEWSGGGEGTEGSPNRGGEGNGGSTGGGVSDEGGRASITDFPEPETGIIK
ncbi:MAG: hypothetical protein OXM55_02605 [Bdellovibrionales bacterium]|nr:hypothetical protein [Bdellovibrionales bacterium]